MDCVRSTVTELIPCVSWVALPCVHDKPRVPAIVLEHPCVGAGRKNLLVWDAVFCIFPSLFKPTLFVYVFIILDIGMCRSR